MIIKDHIMDAGTLRPREIRVVLAEVGADCFIYEAFRRLPPGEWECFDTVRFDNKEKALATVKWCILFLKLAVFLSFPVRLVLDVLKLTLLRKRGL